ncbi:MAG TPA: helix-turn-helix transcriptional regulator [Actinophytocola sp.]|jgi:transcriptional regulator with XRE-family HTH domain|uniref:helix-turn-helix domain-containing protein n=1 Tax=Actinophytocola sp. TaxID=1872138 RepID=UPI002E0B2AF8|nr:helix-turn-helix transcriptional regulator [Actinophytocola sp.]
MRTPKSRALGRALRQAREDNDLRLRDFAAKLGRDPGMLSRWETGERTPRPDQVAQILALLGVNGERYEEIIRLTEGTRASQWLALTLPEQREQLNTLVDLEQSATTITEASPLLIPGLLQITPYIRAIMTSGSVPPDETATRIAIRNGRKEVLKGHNPVRLVALVGEAALCQLIGSPEIMAEQLRYLLDAASWPNVDLRVIPFSTGWHPGLEGLFQLIESKNATPVVQLENRRSGLFLHEDDDIDPYRRAIEMMLRVALNHIDSTDLIARYANRWETAL